MHQSCVMDGKILPNEFMKLLTKTAEFHYFCAQCCESKLPLNKAGERTLKSGKNSSVQSYKQASGQAFEDINRKIKSLAALEKEAKIKIAQTEKKFQKELASQAVINEQLLLQLREKEDTINELRSTTFTINEEPSTGASDNSNHEIPHALLPIIKTETAGTTFVTKENVKKTFDGIENTIIELETTLAAVPLPPKPKLKIIESIATTLHIVTVRNSSTSTDLNDSFDLVHGDIFDRIIDQGSLRFDAYTSTQDFDSVKQTHDIKLAKCIIPKVFLFVGKKNNNNRKKICCDKIIWQKTQNHSNL